MLGREILQRSRRTSARRHEYHQSVAELLDRREAGILEERDRVAPFMDASAGIDAHAGSNPTHFVSDSEVFHELERRQVGLANEMIIALKR